MSDLRDVSYVMSMPPINSSGDIYHILSFLILAIHKNDIPIPRILLTYDAIETAEQITRSFNFAKALGYDKYFDIHSFKEQAAGVFRQNVRQHTLMQYLNKISIGRTIKYLDQKASTSYISYHFSQNRAETVDVLRQGYSRRYLPEAVQPILIEYANYWVRKIKESREKVTQPTVILHIRYSDSANEAQNLSGDFLSKFATYVQRAGYNVWYVFADGRTKGSYVGISRQRISPFCPPLKKDKQNYSFLHDYQLKLDKQIPGYDFGKILHLQLLLSLKEADNTEKFLKGVIGNTSGTLDLAGFIGHNVYNIHQFTQPKISYQDYRILIQMNFLAIGSFQNNIFAEIISKKYNLEANDIELILKNFNAWLLQNILIHPDINFIEPTYDHEGFWELLYYKVITEQSQYKEYVFFFETIKQFVINAFSGALPQFLLTQERKEAVGLSPSAIEPLKFPAQAGQEIELGELPPPLRNPAIGIDSGITKEAAVVIIDQTEERKISARLAALTLTSENKKEKLFGGLSLPEGTLLVVPPQQVKAEVPDTLVLPKPKKP